MATTPSFEQIALNRVTFGARPYDIDRARTMGWGAWVEEQLNPPAGDEPEVAQLLQNAVFRISYAVSANPADTWPALTEDRPLVTLSMDSIQLTEIYDKVRRRELPQAEVNRIGDEVIFANWMRNIHARYQLREFMADFWHRHFNVASAEGLQVVYQLPIYDREVIRGNVFGNFREMVEANAKSTSMLYYLDNADSRRATPNENYARELMELHTIGKIGYLGKTSPFVNNSPVPPPTGTNSWGFTDEDILHASRALSGWTVAIGQRIGANTLPNSGAFVFEPSYHNMDAGMFHGVDLRQWRNDGVVQGEKVIEIAAEHMITAEFVVRKICTRMFGDTPPENVVQAAIHTWRTDRKDPDQIKNVLRTILLAPEIGMGTPVKVRRPYEKTVAFLRAIGGTARPARFMTSSTLTTRDGLFNWPSPDGWPDNNDYWLSTGSMMTQWNNLLTALSTGTMDVSITNESIRTNSATVLVDDWIQRIIGYEISTEGRQALINFATASTGIRGFLGMGTSGAVTIENELRRLVALIATAPEFAYR